MMILKQHADNYFKRLLALLHLKSNLDKKESLERELKIELTWLLG
jgi:hypothetical protein